MLTNYFAYPYGAGIALILMGQCLSATQFIAEELFLKEKNFHPLQVVIVFIFSCIEVRTNIKMVLYPRLLCLGRISSVFDAPFRRRSLIRPFGEGEGEVFIYLGILNNFSRRFNVNVQFGIKEPTNAPIE